jgi:hypothetical protein
MVMLTLECPTPHPPIGRPHPPSIKIDYAVLLEDLLPAHAASIPRRFRLSTARSCSSPMRPPGRREEQQRRPLVCRRSHEEKRGRVAHPRSMTARHSCSAAVCRSEGVAVGEGACGCGGGVAGSERRKGEGSRVETDWRCVSVRSSASRLRHSTSRSMEESTSSPWRAT